MSFQVVAFSLVSLAFCHV